jgi:hypothetical protein
MFVLTSSTVGFQDLCHDSEVNAAYLKDPLVKQQGSLKGISDMLSKVCCPTYSCRHISILTSCLSGRSAAQGIV